MKRTSKINRELSIKGAYVGLIILGLFFAVRIFSQSLFITRPDRLNILFYGQTPFVLSLSNKDNVNYAINYYPDLKILVPGGYGYYRVGGVGKLAYLEKKPEIYKKAFSSASSSLVNLYFYRNKDEVYFGGKEEDEIKLPSYTDVVLGKSNASPFDRLYLLIRLTTLKKSDLTLIDTISEIRKNEGDVMLEEDFAKEYEGFFYQKAYRNERRSVQIVYTQRRKNAELISRMLESSGIRVVDNFFTEIVQKKCMIVEEEKFSQTAKALSRFFNCPLKMGETRLSDIIIMLGEVEESWAYQ